MISGGIRDYMISGRIRDYMISGRIRDYMISGGIRDYMISGGIRDKSRKPDVLSRTMYVGLGTRKTTGSERFTRPQSTRVVRRLSTSGLRD